MNEKLIINRQIKSIETKNKIYKALSSYFRNMALIM